MTHERSFVPLSQVGIFGPPDTLYQGGYFKVSFLLPSIKFDDFFDDIQRRSDAFLHTHSEKRLQ